jgi:ribosomal protein S18
MSRLASGLFFLLFVPLGSLAQEASAPAAPEARARQVAAPPAEEIIRRVRDNQKQLEEQRKNYICSLEEETRKLDAHDAVKKTESKGYEMFFVNGEAILRQISNSGKPLDAGEQRKEQERVNKEIKKARKHAAERERNEDDPNVLGVKQFLAASRFGNARYDSFKAQRVLAYDFEPNPDFKPHTRAEGLANKLSGTVWIDPDALQIVRLEARVTENFHVAGGLLGSLKGGSAVIFEQERINGEVWLPSFADFDVAARLFLVSSLHERVIDRFSNYRKFRVTSKISVTEPEAK